MSARPGDSPAATTLTSAVLPGTTYDASLWVSIGGAASASVNVTQKLQCVGEANASYSWLGQVTVADGAWANISGSIAIPNCQLQEFTLYAEGPGAGIDLYVDDVSVLAPPSQVANIIPDGTFESGQGSWFGWGSGTLGVSNAHAHGGTQSLASVDRTGNATIARNITALVTPGVTYYGSFWVSVDGIEAGSAAVNVTKKIQCVEDSASYTWLGQVTVANGAWAEIQGELAIPDCELADVTLFAEGPSSGSLYVDDVVVSP